MAVAACAAYSGVMSVVLLKIIGAVMPLRADAAEESTGLDMTQHGEEAYVHAEGAVAMSNVSSQVLGGSHGFAEGHSATR
jgi:Amt family ammonium transporter